nr:MAG TPA: hypothetical protein [Caudoviricetes sp.]
MDKPEIDELEKELNELWNHIIDEIALYGKMTKKYTIIKLTEKLRNEEEKNRQV